MTYTSSRPKLHEQILNLDLLDLALRLSALLLMLHIFRSKEAIDVLAQATLVGGLICLPLLRTPWPWFICAVLLLLRISGDAFVLDNHIYLSCYWCLAIGTCMTASEEKKLTCLKTNARLLLGLCMLFAVIWKAISPSYMDNSFFHFLMLSDNRFHDFARLLGGLTPEIIAHNHAVFSSMQDQALPLAGIQPDLQTSPGLRPLSLFLTWWTIIIESILAVAFLMPDSHRVNVVRHACLLVFAISTYLIAPVLGFGITLLVFGLLNCPMEWRRTRLLYIGVIIFVELSALSFVSMLAARL